MGIIIKASISSLFEKKARTFLVLFSIAVSASLMFANESFSRTVSQRFYEADVRWSGNSDFYIQTQKAVGAEEWIDADRLAAYGDVFDYVFPFIKEQALYMPSLEQMHYFTIIGADIEAFNRHNPVTLAEGSFEEWGGNTIIVGKTYADIYDLHVNDTLRLELNNSEYLFRIVGISEPKGLFLRELADRGFILAPHDTLAGIFNGQSNLIFLKLKDRSQRVAFMERLTQDFSEYAVHYGINDEVIAAETQNYVMPFQVSSVVVVFMCMFIIFTAFNLITLERIPIVGTLRSIGCTRKRINIIFLIESAVLGAVGGLFGCLLGVVVLQYIKSLYFTGDDAALNATVLFGAREVLVAVGSAVIITTASAVLPILRLTKTPIKNIILNDLSKKASTQTRLWIVGLALIAACLVVPRFLGSNFIGMIIASVLATGALVGLVPVVPFLTRHFARLIAKLPFLSQDVLLGVRNVRDHAGLLNNIQLFSAAIAIVAFMASMFSTMGADLVKAFDRDMTFDIRLVLRNSDRDTLGVLNSVDGVAASAGSYQTHTSILNHGTFLNVLYGIEDTDYFNFNQVRELENNRQAFADLNAGKHIITTNVLKDKLGLKLGDSLLLQFGSKEVPYSITGFVETNVGIGHVGYISAENYRAEMGVTGYDFIYIKGAAGAERVKNNLLRALGKEVMSIETKQELIEANADKVIAVFKAINTYCYLALLVGVIGILNNLVASFIERQRSFALYRCVGMSKRSLNRMLVTEAVTMGALGVGYGILCALVMSSAIPVMVSILWGKVQLQLAATEMALISTIGILAMLGISIVPVLRSQKMSLIQTIKYE